MKAKLKQCSKCSEMRRIWGTRGREKYCVNCWKLLKQDSGAQSKNQPKDKRSIARSLTPIAKMSDKRKKQTIAYTALRKAYLQTHTMCQAKLIGCLNKATDLHHLFWGADRDQHMNDFANVLAVCRMCHSAIHNTLSAEEAREKGFKK